jgi:hypothetical protein
LAADRDKDSSGCPGSPGHGDDREGADVPGSGSGGRHHRALPEVHPAERQPEGLAAKAAGDSCCVNVNQCYLCTSVDGTELLARDRDRRAREPVRQQADTAVGHSSK